MRWLKKQPPQPSQTTVQDSVFGPPGSIGGRLVELRLRGCQLLIATVLRVMPCPTFSHHFLVHPLGANVDVGQ